MAIDNQANNRNNKFPSFSYGEKDPKNTNSSISSSTPQPASLLASGSAVPHSPIISDKLPTRKRVIRTLRNALDLICKFLANLLSCFSKNEENTKNKQKIKQDFGTSQMADTLEKSGSKALSTLANTSSTITTNAEQTANNSLDNRDTVYNILFKCIDDNTFNYDVFVQATKIHQTYSQFKTELFNQFKRYYAVDDATHRLIKDTIAQMYTLLCNSPPLNSNVMPDDKIKKKIVKDALHCKKICTK